MSIEQEPRTQTQASATQRRYRTLAVVRQEAITRVETPLEDSVFVWRLLLVREFFSATIVTVMVTLLALVINAPLFFFQAEDGIRDLTVTGVQTCALPI